MAKRPVLDRMGDWSIKATKDVIAHPAIAGGVTTVVLFVIARIPTQVFYAEFGVRPEDAGLDSVQVLLQGATAALLISFGVGLVYGLLMPIFIFAYVSVMSPAVSSLVETLKKLWPGNKDGNERGTQVAEEAKPNGRAWIEAYRAAARRAVRLAPIFVPVTSIVFALVFLTFAASDDAAAVKEGWDIDPRLMPWKAVPVDISWTGAGPHPQLPGCSALFYLGEGGDRVLLFDSAGEEAVRIYSKDIELSFPEDC
jgi:hypothetical protein